MSALYVSPGRSHDFEGDLYDLFVPSDTVASLFLGSLGRAPPSLQSVKVGRLPGRAAVESLTLMVERTGSNSTHPEGDQSQAGSPECSHKRKVLAQERSHDVTPS